MKNDTSAAIFEEILSRIRPFGYFQKRLYFLTSLIQVFVTTVILYVDFVYLNVKNSKCTLSSRILPDNVTNISTPGETENPCGFNQWEVPTWMIGEFASDKFTYIWLCQGCGIIAGAVVSGFLSDLVGRKTVLYVNLMMMSLAQGSLCILDDWVLFLISRGLVGIFAGGVIVPSCVQMIEHVGQNWRELSVCFCAWALGIPLLILEGLVTRHWRWLGIVTSFTSLLSIAYILRALDGTPAERTFLKQRLAFGKLFQQMPRHFRISPSSTTEQSLPSLIQCTDDHERSLTCCTPERESKQPLLLCPSGCSPVPSTAVYMRGWWDRCPLTSI